MTDIPRIRLKPKIDPRPLKWGFPWVYANELVTDRRTKAIAPGAIALLEDTDRNPIATVTVNPASRIMARVLDVPDTAIDADWLRGRIASALALRETLYDAPFYRLVHAEGDRLPGLIIDRFGDTLVIQPNAAYTEVMFDDLAQVCADVTGATTIVKNASGRSRSLEGLDEESSVWSGAVDGVLPVQMNNATYMADLIGGQKTGLFFDQRPNHAFAQRLSKGARVLDVFSHVGGFGLAALAAGADHAVAIDGSQPALDLAVQGAEAMGCADRFETRKGDAFEMMETARDAGEKYDLVICDPPAFAPNKPALEKGLRAYERVARIAAELVAPGGYLGLCSCSHAADVQKFGNACQRGIGRAGRRAQHIYTGYAGPDHPQLPQLSESGYLKALFYRLA